MVRLSERDGEAEQKTRLKTHRFSIVVLSLKNCSSSSSSSESSSSLSPPSSPLSLERLKPNADECKPLRTGWTDPVRRRRRRSRISLAAGRGRTKAVKGQSRIKKKGPAWELKTVGNGPCFAFVASSILLTASSDALEISRSAIWVDEESQPRRLESVRVASALTFLLTLASSFSFLFSSISGVSSSISSPYPPMRELPPPMLSRDSNLGGCEYSREGVTGTNSSAFEGKDGS